MKLFLASVVVGIASAFTSNYDRRTYTNEKSVSDVTSFTCADYYHDDRSHTITAFDLGEPVHTGTLAEGGSIRWSGVADDVDLVVTSDSSYRANSGRSEKQLNGQVPDSPGYQRLNVMVGTTATFKFTFRNSVTDNEVTIPSFFFSFLDLDTVLNKKDTVISTETIDVSDAKRAIVWENTNLQQDEAGVWSQIVSMPVESIRADDPTQLTEAQQANSVTFKFKQLSSFYVTFAVNAKAVKETVGRNLVFSMGRFPLSCSAGPVGCRGWCIKPVLAGIEDVCEWGDFQDQCYQCPYYTCPEVPTLEPVCYQWCMDPNNAISQREDKCGFSGCEGCCA